MRRAHAEARRGVVALALGALLAGPVAAGVDFALPGLDGRVQRLSDYRGRWVVVNFWATWCAPCLEEIPELIAFHRAHAQRDAVVMGVNFEDIDTGLLAEFVADMGIEYPVVRAGDEPLVPFEPLRGLPSTFLVTPAGALDACRVGAVTRASLEAYLAAAPTRSITTASPAGGGPPPCVIGDAPWP